MSRPDAGWSRPGCTRRRAAAACWPVPATFCQALLTAEGDLDFRGTLGVDKAVPVGSRDIRLRFDLDTDIDDEQLATLLKLTERYCVFCPTLKHPPPISMQRANRTATP